MIGLCEEGKALPSRREERGCKLFEFFSAWCWPLGRGSYSRIEPDFHLLAQLFWLPRRLSLCLPASFETYRREHQEFTLLRSVGLTARPGRNLALKKVFCAVPLQAAVRVSWSITKKWHCPRSTDIKYATSFLATARVARLPETHGLVLRKGVRAKPVLISIY